MRDTQYANKLDFRVRYDSQIIEAHKNQVRKAMHGERARDLNDKKWMDAAFTVKDDSPGLYREIEIEVPKSPKAKILCQNVILEIEILGERPFKGVIKRVQLIPTEVNLKVLV